MTQEFPTYEKVFSSLERSKLGEKFWCEAFPDYSDDEKRFDEQVNHKFYDEFEIPRRTLVPVDFEI
jgi:hypothetical protein